MNNNKYGFTLIEVVVSITLLSILSMGFLQVFGGSLGITKKNIAFDKATNDFAYKIDMGDNNDASVDTKSINLGNGHSITLHEYTLDDPESDNVFIYYRYPTP
ncbi:MAG: type II secretion system protein J [Sedimentibacter sp.]